MQIAWTSDLAGRSYDFIIVGAGPAGLYLAERLAGAGSALVIEAGLPEEPFAQGDGYYDIDITGRSYFPLGSRLSAFGGTSNHWGGNCHPLPPELFEDSGGDWPMAYQDYARHLDDAARFLDVEPFSAGATSAAFSSGVFAGNRELSVLGFRFSAPVARFGDDAGIARMRADASVDYLLGCRVLDLALDAAGQAVASAQVLDRRSRETLTLPVRTLILAAGGIESARLMLWAARNYQPGNPLAGGPARLTGANFTEKPFIAPVDTYVDATADLADALPHDDYSGCLAWEPETRFRAEHRLPRFAMFAGHAAPVGDTAALDRIEPLYAGHAPAYVRLTPPFQFEQTAHAGSYVSLSERRDAAGTPLAALHWELLDSDISAFRRAVLLTCGLLNQHGHAKSRLRDGFRSADWSGAEIGICNHHLGTTKMGRSRADGVVDANCQVFGLANLFIAGSSIFPSSAYANPTLNLVAMAGRLAEHLRAGR